MKYPNLILAIALLSFLSLLICIYFFFPHWYYSYIGAEHCYHNHNADGIISPIIAIFAVIATLIAFGAQVNANIQHKDRMEMDKIEKAVFEFINLHLNITNSTSISKDISGKEAFHFMFYEFKSLYEMLKRLTKEENYEISNIDSIKIAFNCFYYGIDDLENKTNIEEINSIYDGKHDRLMEKYIRKIQSVQHEARSIRYKTQSHSSNESDNNELMQQTIFLREYILQNYIFNLYDGHMLRLDSYIRLVKNVLDYINQAKISTADKEFLYELFRCQFSSHQLLIICLYGIYDPKNEWIPKKYFNYASSYNFLKYIPKSIISKIIEDPILQKDTLGY